MAITTWLATTGDWDDSKFSRPWDGPNLAPDKGDLTLSSSKSIEIFLPFGVVQLYKFIIIILI